MLLCVELPVMQGAYPFPGPQLPAVPQTPPGATQNQPAVMPDQLDSLVAPIALYPDPILSQLLVASTCSLEIVEAARWLAANSTTRPSPGRIQQGLNKGNLAQRPANLNPGQCSGAGNGMHPG